MRHKRTGRKLGVVTKHRRAMFRNMATDLFRHESITTTDARAKEIRRVAEKMITLAKKGTLQARRQAAAFIKDKDVLKKLFSEIADKYKDRPGGYTRIIKMGYRKGDNAPLSLIEIVQEDFKPKKKKKKKTTPKSVSKNQADTKKSTKKESAEELGLIEDTAKAAVAEDTVTDDTLEKTPKIKEDTKAEETTNKVEANEVTVQEEAETKTDAVEEAKTEETSEEIESKEETVVDETESDEAEAKVDSPKDKTETDETKSEEAPEEVEAKETAAPDEADVETVTAEEEQTETEKPETKKEEE